MAMHLISCFTLNSGWFFRVTLFTGKAIILLSNIMCVATNLVATPTATGQWCWCWRSHRLLPGRILLHLSCFINKWAQNVKLLTLSLQLQWNQSFIMLNM